MGPAPLQTPPERSDRARQAAAVLPILGLFLLIPPVIGLFAVPLDVAGVPLIVVYLFAVWLALALAAALLGRALERPDPPPDPAEPPPA